MRLVVNIFPNGLLQGEFLSWATGCRAVWASPNRLPCFSALRREQRNGKPSEGAPGMMFGARNRGWVVNTPPQCKCLHSSGGNQGENINKNKMACTCYFTYIILLDFDELLWGRWCSPSIHQMYHSDRKIRGLLIFLILPPLQGVGHMWRREQGLRVWAWFGIRLGDGGPSFILVTPVTSSNQLGP